MRLSFFMRVIYIFLFLITIILCSCSSSVSSIDDTVAINPQNVILFYLDSLKGHNLLKISEVNGQIDTNLITNANWAKEMDFLEDLNTNKPAFKGALQIDSLRKNDTLVYTLICNENNIKLKKVTLKYYKQQLIDLTATLSTSNFLFNTYKEIYFNPLQGYTIKGFQKLDKTDKLKVDYFINCKKG